MDWTRNEERKWSFLVRTHTHTNVMHFCTTHPLNSDWIRQEKRKKKVVISSPTNTHTNIMHFCTTHLLNLRMDWTGNGESGHFYSYTYTHKHHALLYNLPSKVENGLDKKTRKSCGHFQSYKYTHKHHALLYNLPSKVENGLDKKQGKEVVISSPYTHTQKLCTSV